MHTALETAAAIRRREVSPVEVLDECLDRVDKLDDRINAVVWRNDDEARAAARQAEAAVLQTDPDELAPFHGVPIPIKDLTPVEGWPVTYGSWAGPEAPSKESELVVDAFRRGGFVLTARTNTPEFGPITAAENARYGITRNPWDTEHTPGGSSGGAAAATAAGMFPLAHANDGGGSIRIPASCCGLVGLKVSRGRIPRLTNSWEGGVVEGVVTHDVADTAAVLDVISGPDRGCWYNAPAPDRPFRNEVGADPGPLRVGLLRQAPMGLPIAPACTEAAEAAARALEGLGHAVVDAELDLPDETVSAFLNVVNSGFADYEGIDWERAEPHVQAGRQAGLAVDSLVYVHSVHVLQRFTRRQVARWGRQWDVLVMPTMTIEPPRAGEVLAAAHEAAASGGPALLVLQMALLTSGFNLTGQPAISVPVHVTATGLPIGVQVVSGPWEEARLLRVAARLEEALPWADRVPSL